MAADTSRLWAPLVHRLTPYVPGEQRSGNSIVKLNTNENPYPPSPQVLEAVASCDGDALRRYPDPEATQLRRQLASYHQLHPEQVFVGNGSDEILALAFMAFFTGRGALQFPELSYSFYPVYCDLLDINQDPLPMGENFAIDMSAFGNSAGGIVFPNPNAPTSMAVDKSAIIELLERVPDTVVLVDEAYADFGARSVVSLASQYPNLLVSQTFSKGRSMAGMRVGAAFGSRDLIDALQRVKNSFNSYPLDVLAQRAAIASLHDESYYKQTLERIIATREWSVTQLVQRGYEVLPSAANFLFVRVPDGQAQALFEHLGRQDILVRYWNKPGLSDWLRITVGTDEEMQALLTSMDSFRRA